MRVLCDFLVSFEIILDARGNASGLFKREKFVLRVYAFFEAHIA